MLLCQPCECRAFVLSHLLLLSQACRQGAGSEEVQVLCQNAGPSFSPQAHLLLWAEPSRSGEPCPSCVLGKMRRYPARSVSCSWDPTSVAESQVQVLTLLLITVSTLGKDGDGVCHPHRLLASRLRLAQP